MARSPGDVRAGGAFIELGTDNIQLEKGLKAAQSTLAGWSLQISALAAGMLSPIAIALKQFSDVGDSAAKTAKRLGISPEQLQGYRHLSELSGGTADLVDSSMQRMLRGANEAAKGEGKLVEVFKTLNLNAKAFAGLSTDQKMMVLADAFKAMGDEKEAIGAAFDIFGRGGVTLINTMKEGSEGIMAARYEAQLLGIAFGNDAAPKAEALNDAIYRMKKSIDGFKFTIAAMLAEEAVDWLEWMTALTIAVRQYLEIHPEFLAAFLNAAKFVLLATGAVTGLYAAIWLLATGAGPIGVIAIAVLYLLDSFGMLETGATETFEQIKIGSMSLQGWMTGIGDAIVLGNQKVWDAVRDAAGRSLDWIIARIRDLGYAVMWVMNQLHIISDETLDKGWIENQNDAIFRKAYRDSRQEQMKGFQDTLLQEGQGRVADDRAKTAKYGGIQEIMDRTKAAFAQLQMLKKPDELGLGDLSADISGATPGTGKLPEMGVHGFFGNIAENVGGAYGSKPIEEKQLEKLGNIEDILKAIRDNPSGGVSEATFA